jgi:hypothetical protein
MKRLSEEKFLCYDRNRALALEGWTFERCKHTLKQEREPGNLFLSSQEQEKLSQLKEIFVEDGDEEKIIKAIRLYNDYNIE